MSTSVIIPTMNEIIGIQHTLPQVDRNWADEWIVIDNNSNDGTPEEAKNAIKKVFDSKVCRLYL